VPNCGEGLLKESAVAGNDTTEWFAIKERIHLSGNLRSREREVLLSMGGGSRSNFAQGSYETGGGVWVRKRIEVHRR